MNVSKRMLMAARNRDIMEAYDEIMRSLGEEAYYISRPEIVERLLSHGARQFYVLPERAMREIAHYERYGRFISTSRTAVEKYMEIYRRFKSYGGKVWKHRIDIINDIVTQPAPSFYMTSGSMRMRIINLLHRNVQE